MGVSPQDHGETEVRQPCWGCGAVVSASRLTTIGGDADDGIATICWICGFVAVLTEVFGMPVLRKPTPGELADIEAQPEFMVAIEARKQHPFSSIIAAEAARMRLSRSQETE